MLDANNKWLYSCNVQKQTSNLQILSHLADFVKCVRSEILRALAVYL